MPQRSTWLAALLAASLALNIWTLMRLGEVQQAIRHLGQSEDLQRIMDELSGLEHRINTLAEQQNWLSRFDQRVQDEGLACGDEVPVELNWTFRELPAESAVQVIFRPAGGEWRTVDALETAPLTYTALLSLSGTENWEYQIIAQGPWGRRSDPVRRLDLKAKREAVLEFGPLSGIRADNGEAEWHLYAAQRGPKQALVCRSISGIEVLTLDRNQQVVQRVAMTPVHPDNQGDMPDKWEARLATQDSEVAAEAVFQFSDGTTSRLRIDLTEGGKTVERAVSGP